MNIVQLIEKSLLEGYASSDLNITTMFVCIGFTAAISFYIYCVYKVVNRNSFYNKNFNLSLIGLAIITASVILTIQSNIVVSLGMVGALSIVRFRTAIKDPLDLVFLFWSISVGIICGAGYAMIGVISSIVLTVFIVLFEIFPTNKGSVVLVVQADSPDEEVRIMSIVRSYCKQYLVRARTATKSSLNLAIEVKTRHGDSLVKELVKHSGINSASIVEHNGDITA